eukprot:TRINITY_DN5569_c0_g1_i1.p1 TRINITY_DN5569_c0_g1~~TRINITY_DN5569_c0_g1_i1.p1  ORF type:complete len:711 (+),score=293.80 TRINITY_DN5569_c0_g1_i1:106-2238(+)
MEKVFWRRDLIIGTNLENKKKNDNPPSEEPIQITLPDGTIVDGKSGITCPLDVAFGISKKLGFDTIVAEVDGVLVDAKVPLVKSCELILHTFQSEKGQETFWHSSAHVLGEALELIFGCHLTIGPPLDEGGFYYDMAFNENENNENEKKSIVESDYAKINQMVKKIVKDRQAFERMVLTKEEALELFKYNKYKVELINSKIQDGVTCTAYRCGPLVDLCRGPHIPSTGSIKVFDVLKTSSAYWLGNAKNDALQRVYGISFPDKKLHKEWKRRIEEAKKRDHRLLGTQQELFFFNSLTAGSPFMLPMGTRIYNKLFDFLKAQYVKRGFTEVMSPNIFNVDLWKTSGHWQNYQENMFTFDVEGMPFALKPMNCPGHCLMFKHRARSYRELPIRFADFGVLHRNEFSGALTGLTRVRRFCQDDAHIFCRPEQIMEELQNAMAFMEYVYGVFDFKFDLELSTKPEKALGDDDLWEHAEAVMEEVLEKCHPGNWKLNPGDGAFYGPKIDIHITDALGRSHQCATIQLDFQLPIRFGLEYNTNDEKTERPVIIHRAIYGSFERFMAILIEHTAGKWPFWISPRQFIIIPVHEKSETQIEYCRSLEKQLERNGFFCEVDDSVQTFKKKIARFGKGREGTFEQFYSYCLVVGNKEVETNSVNVRDKTGVLNNGKAIPFDRVLECAKHASENHSQFLDFEFDSENNNNNNNDTEDGPAN